MKSHAVPALATKAPMTASKRSARSAFLASGMSAEIKYTNAAATAAFPMVCQGILKESMLAHLYFSAMLSELRKYMFVYRQP